MNNDFKLFRILAILSCHFHNFWIIGFFTCKAICPLVKTKILVFLECWLYQEVVS